MIGKNGMNRMPSWLIAMIAAVVGASAFGSLVLPLLSAQDLVAEARERYADIPGVRIFYTDTGGRGVPVVFLHSGTGSSQNWEHQIPAFTAAGYRFIAYDRRGWGRSVSVPAGAQAGTDVDDLQALMDHLGIERFHLVGTAAGGFVALDYALSYPKRLRSLVMANSTGGVVDAEYLELGRRIRPALFDTMPPEFREIGPSYRAANPEGTRKWIELERISRPKGTPLVPQAMKNRVTFSLLEKIEVPTLLIAGDTDFYAPPPFLRFFTSRIKKSESAIIPEAGHSSYWEQPEIFNRTVLEFLRKH